MEEVASPVSLLDRRGRRRRGPVDPQELVVATVAEHAESLLRVARRYTGCAADAEDAYQRALEVFVRSAHRLDPATAHKWLHTVCKNEALEVRRQRAKLVVVDDDEALDRLDDGRYLPSTEERSERFDELQRAAEALGRLKPQEVTALVLKAQGLSYAEIAERQNWTYTKVNRCLTEGRRSFLRRYAGIEAGEECARFQPVLSALADGEATPAQLADARPHLRNCAACRAMLGDLHRGTAQAAALLPVGLLAGVGEGARQAGGAIVASVGEGAAEAGGRILARVGELLVAAQERIAAPALKLQAALETASASKVVAVAASTAAIAGGGVAVERHAGGEPARAADRPAPAVRAPAAAPGARPNAGSPFAPAAPAPERTAEARTAGGDETPTVGDKTATDGDGRTPARRDDGRGPDTEFAAEADGPAMPDPPPAPAPSTPPPPRLAGADAAPPTRPPARAPAPRHRTPGEFGLEGG